MMIAFEAMTRALRAVTLEASVAPDAVGLYCNSGCEIVDTLKPSLFMAKPLK